MPSVVEEFLKELPKNVGRVVLKCHKVLANFVTGAINDYNKIQAQQMERQRIKATEEMISETLCQLYGGDKVWRHFGCEKEQVYQDVKDDETGQIKKVLDYTKFKPVVSYRKKLFQFPCECYEVSITGELDDNKIKILRDKWYLEVTRDGKVGYCVRVRGEDDPNKKYLAFLSMDKDRAKEFDDYRLNEPRLFL